MISGRYLFPNWLSKYDGQERCEEIIMLNGMDKKNWIISNLGLAQEDGMYMAMEEKFWQTFYQIIMKDSLACSGKGNK